ncbi:LAGLIDADG family homing endonuclease [Halalkaliarchaeum sp. AArc-CO]|uniref:LAGLIDADG family homing endonuclease n=1 Tax=Halalkaliarchaeum sp. AArc-CO TaxID=2866381 RepID=UPI00217CD0D8|nr:LAGLIDADG family homing endonuclease [Halalkaliarchaeum sp. AArc-CO]
MATAGTDDLTERFIQFYRNYYREQIGQLAQRYPNEQRSLYVDYDDLYTFDPDLAEDYLAKPEQFREYAEEALRLYDLPADVSLGQAHVRVENLPRSKTIDIRGIRVQDDHIGRMIAVQGIVRKATDVRPKITEAAFECQRCGTMTYIPQSDSGFQEPHECQGCERQGPFRVNHDQSEFIDSQKLRVQESPEGLRGGQTPQAIDVDVEDDITGKVTPGDHVTVAGVLHIEQMTDGNEKTPVFDLYMDGVSISIEDEEFEDMDITQDDVQDIIERSSEDDIYQQMVDSVAPSIYGYEQEKLAMILQLFSGVTKHLPDGSRIRGDLHMLLIGDPGTGKCVAGDTMVTLADGRRVPIRELVEDTLDDPKPVDDGVYDEVDICLPSMNRDGTFNAGYATRVWKREAPERMIRIRTASGKEIEATPSHPLYVQSGGEPSPVVADDLTEGTFIATPRTLDTKGDDTFPGEYRRSRSANSQPLELPEEWTPSLARLLGYIIAEGYVERRDDNTGFISICNNDEEILSDVKDALDRINVNYFERDPHRGKSAREVIASSGQLASLLENIDQRLLEGSAAQRVPAAIQLANRRTKREFLKAYIEGESHVSTTQREITVASMSKELLEDVQHLLLFFGIYSQLRERDNGSYRLRISGNDAARYINEIGFISERKSKTASRFKEVRSNTNTDVVPSMGDVLRDLRESLELTQRECGIPRTTYQHYERGDRNPSRTSLRTVVSQFKNTFDEREPVQSRSLTDGGRGIGERIQSLTNLVENQVQWDKIERIEEIDPSYEWVYDLEVKGTHNYLSNGIVSHNSQLLSYIQNIAPRSVYTSGKGSSSAGLTAAAVRDDFGDGQQWTLEAGALVLADKGIAAVDELDKMRSEDRSAMHEALEQQSYHPETEVLLADGRRVEIGPFVDRLFSERNDEVTDGVDCEILPVDDVSVHSTDLETNETRKVPVDRVSRHEAPEEFVRVTFSNGRSVTVTPEHPMFVSRDGETKTVPARDVDVDEFVPAPRQLPNSAAAVELAEAPHVGKETDVTLPDEMSPKLAEFLGFLVAEGHSYVGRTHEIGFSNQDQRLLDRVGKLVDDLFGMSTADHANAAGTITMALISTKLYRWFESNFPELLNTARDKRIPAKVLAASQEEIRRFLVGAFAGDGGVESEAMSFSTASPGLAEDYADALSKIGVASRTHHDTAEDSWKVYVMGDSVGRFVDAVVEDTPNKIATGEPERSDRSDGNGDLRYYRIRNVERIPNEGENACDWVYDVTVEPTNTFVSKGVVLHNSISISKAGINATLKSRCSLLGAANPKYGRFDQYEPLGEQIDLEPALISRFDLIFTVTDQPDPDHDARLADHILTTNYAGEMNTQRERLATSEFTESEVQQATQEVEPVLDQELLRKYIAYAKRNCFPTMTDEAREAIRDFYVDLRAQGADEDAPVPVTARKLEALVRLSEASARVRLSDTVDREDAERVIDIVESSLQDIGVDPETGQFDADVIETGTSKSQRDRIKSLKGLIEELEDEFEEGAPVDEVLERADEVGMDPTKAEDEIEKLRAKGEVYEPRQNHLRTT